AWGALAGALLFKESGLLLAPLAAASERLLPRRKRDSALHAGLWLIAGAYLILRALGLPRRLAGIPEPNAVCHVLTALKIGWWYLGQLALPTSLCLEHSFAPVRSAWSLESAALAAATGAAGFGVLRLARRDRVAGFALFWCGLFLLPFLNLIPYLNLSLVANRYLYLSSAGFLLALARLASAARARARLGLAAAAGALAVFYASRDVVHGAMFSNPLTLWVATSRCAPGNPRPHAALASVLLGMRRYAEVEAEAAQAIALEPQFPLPYQSFAAACAETGKLEQALGLARERVALDPDPAGLQVLGTLLMRAGRLEEACPMLEGALARDPEGWDIALSLGECELKAGRLARARERLSAAAKAPQLRSRALWLLGDVELRQGRPEASLSLRELSVELNPLDRDHLRALAGAYARAAGTREVWRLYARSLGAVDAAAVWTVGDSRRQLQELRAELVRDRDGILSRPARSRRG
ncbi:MAG TPA: tetratricopeptide repeat protein, partial [Elusimicrobiota bacterium]|nr:tetratricopeptide repeat protein [Elusimicrobiota bacterium]